MATRTPARAGWLRQQSLRQFGGPLRGELLPQLQGRDQDLRRGRPGQQGFEQGTALRRRDAHAGWQLLAGRHAHIAPGIPVDRQHEPLALPG